MQTALHMALRRMAVDSKWSAVPTDVLRRAFASQPNALANSAAASTCTAWRDAATNVHANCLHMHAESDSQQQRWQSILASKTSIDSLTLSRRATVTAQLGRYIVKQSDAVTIATVNSIPVACRALTLSEFAAYGIAQYFIKSPAIEQLSMQWNGIQAV